MTTPPVGCSGQSKIDKWYQNLLPKQVQSYVGNGHFNVGEGVQIQHLEAVLMCIQCEELDLGLGNQVQENMGYNKKTSERDLEFMIQSIYQHEGDFFDLIDDTIIILWSVSMEEDEFTMIDDNKAFIQKSLLLASKCALEIQDKQQNSEFKYRIGIGVGKTKVCYLLRSEAIPQYNYFIDGEAYLDAIDCLKVAETTTAVLSKASMSFISDMCEGIQMPSNKTILRKLFSDVGFNHRIAETEIPVNNNCWKIFVSPVISLYANQLNNSFSNEFRSVSVVYINLTFHEKLSKLKMEDLQEIIQFVEKIFFQFDGTFWKCYTHEFGFAIVGVFGLVGMTHQNDPFLAIICAIAISADFSKRNINFSMGVASSKCFCAFSGQPFSTNINNSRSWFSIYGDALLRSKYHAFRASKSFPFYVICDKETKESAIIYQHSSISFFRMGHSEDLLTSFNVSSVKITIEESYLVKIKEPDRSTLNAASTKCITNSDLRKISPQMKQPSQQIRSSFSSTQSSTSTLLYKRSSGRRCSLDDKDATIREVLERSLTFRSPTIKKTKSEYDEDDDRYWQSKYSIPWEVPHCYLHYGITYILENLLRTISFHISGNVQQSSQDASSVTTSSQKMRRKEHGIFICGNAGSGKSVLLNYLIAIMKSNDILDIFSLKKISSSSSKMCCVAPQFVCLVTGKSFLNHHRAYLWCEVIQELLFLATVHARNTDCDKRLKAKLKTFSIAITEEKLFRNDLQIYSSEVEMREEQFLREFLSHLASVCPVILLFDSCEWMSNRDWQLTRSILSQTVKQEIRLSIVLSCRPFFTFSFEGLPCLEEGKQLIADLNIDYIHLKNLTISEIEYCLYYSNYGIEFESENAKVKEINFFMAQTGGKQLFLSEMLKKKSIDFDNDNDSCADEEYFLFFEQSVDLSFQLKRYVQELTDHMSCIQWNILQCICILSKVKSSSTAIAASFSITGVEQMLRKVFSYKPFSGDIDKVITDSLSALQLRGIIKYQYHVTEASHGNSVQLMFDSIFIRECIYERLCLKNRISMHLEAAKILKQRIADINKEKGDLLLQIGFHYLLANFTEKGFESFSQFFAMNSDENILAKKIYFWKKVENTFIKATNGTSKRAPKSRSVYKNDAKKLNCTRQSNIVPIPGRSSVISSSSFLVPITNEGHYSKTSHLWKKLGLRVVQKKIWWLGISVPWVVIDRHEKTRVAPKVLFLNQRASIAEQANHNATVCNSMRLKEMLLFPFDTMSIDTFQSDIIVQQQARIFHRINEWEFDVFELADYAKGCILSEVFLLLMNMRNLLVSLNVDAIVVQNFIVGIEKGYLSENPYHNATHATDVLQTIHILLNAQKAPSMIMSHTEIFSVLVAGAMHDFKHPGLNNKFHVDTKHELAVKYSNQQVLERFHISEAMNFINDSSNNANIFAENHNFDVSSMKLLITELVLATSLSEHFIYVKAMKIKLDAKEMLTANDYLHICIKCADISNGAKPFAIYRKWCDLVMEEFYIQGDLERSNNLPVSDFMDRRTPQIKECQVGFLKFIVIPMYEILSRVCPPSTFIFQCYLNSNLKFWTVDPQGNESSRRKKEVFNETITVPIISSFLEKYSKKRNPEKTIQQKMSRMSQVFF